MNVAVDVREVFSSIGETVVGFNPSTHSVKPVHIANGLFRVVLGGTADTDLLFKFVFSQTEKGKILRGHDLQSVYTRLAEQDRIDTQEVPANSLPRLRALLKSIVGADGAVFDRQMQSYTAGATGFVTNDTIAQGGGELVAEWMRLRVPSLFRTVEDALRRRDDPTSVLCAPLLEDRIQNARLGPTSGALLSTPRSDATAALWDGLRTAGETLERHIAVHPNKLIRLRLVVTFTSFVLLRYLSALESAHVAGAHVPPFLLDFSDRLNGSVRQASQVAYLRACNAMGRFYAWAFGAHLRTLYSADELLALRDDLPQGNPKTTTPEGIRELWYAALDEAHDADDPFAICGQALYEIAAHDDGANPVPYFRALGQRSGLLWPPANRQPNKQFTPQEDMLEVLIRGAVEPDESLDLPSLQARLWDRYGVVVGGRTEDEEVLDRGGVYQADANALRANRQDFAARLGALDFAELLADGVLHVQVGGR